MNKLGLLGGMLFLLAHIVTCKNLQPIENQANNATDNSVVGAPQDGGTGNEEDSPRWSHHFPGGHAFPVHPDFSPSHESFEGISALSDGSMSSGGFSDESPPWSESGSSDESSSHHHKKRRTTPKPSTSGEGSDDSGSDSSEGDSHDDHSGSDGSSGGGSSSSDGSSSGSGSSESREKRRKTTTTTSTTTTTTTTTTPPPTTTVPTTTTTTPAPTTTMPHTHDQSTTTTTTTTPPPTTTKPATTTASDDSSSHEAVVCVKPPPIMHKRDPNPDSMPIETSRSHGRVCGIRWNRCTCHRNPYRTYDGTCNNLRNPDSGIPQIPLTRVVPARYCDGLKTPRRSYTNDKKLPSARKVTSSLFDTKPIKHPHLTQLTAIFWIFVVTDIFMLKRRDDEDTLQCCSPDGGMIPQQFLMDTCLPIKIPKNDPFFSAFGQRCIHYERSGISPECREDPHRPIEQINLQTSFLDLSIVYGINKKENKKLRTLKKGQMRTKRLHHHHHAKLRHQFLPNVDDATKVCGLPGRHDPCYYTANPQANKMVTIAAIQTLFVRQHNRIAHKLHEMHPKLEDEDLFQQARKIMIGIYHNMIYNQWLSHVLGQETQKRLRLPFFKLSATYNANINPGAISDLAGAGFALSSTMIPKIIHFMDDKRRVVKRIDVIASIDDPSSLEKQGGFDGATIGMCAQPIYAFDKNFIKEIMELTLASPDGKTMGMDLVATDIQSGRDLGISTYNDARVLCGLRRAKEFQNFNDTIPPEEIEKLAKVYACPDDLDLMAGMVLEKPYDSGLVGRVTSCLIGEQFARLRTGDRFFTNVEGFKHSFTKEQLEAILATSFSTLVCESSDGVTHMQHDPFLRPSPGNPLRSCHNIPKLNLKPWKECKIPPIEC